MVVGSGGVGGLSAGTARRPRWVALADLQSQNAPPALSHQAMESSTSTSSQRGTDVLVMLVVLVLVALVVPVVVVLSWRHHRRWSQGPVQVRWQRLPILGEVQEPGLGWSVCRPTNSMPTNQFIVTN